MSEYRDNPMRPLSVSPKSRSTANPRPPPRRPRPQEEEEDGDYELQPQNNINNVPGSLPPPRLRTPSTRMDSGSSFDENSPRNSPRNSSRKAPMTSAELLVGQPDASRTPKRVQSRNPLLVNSPSTSPPPASPKEKNNQSIFKGENSLQYVLWAHYLTLGACLLSFICGIFAVVWVDSTTYKCKIDDKYISTRFLYTSDGTCPTQYTRPNGEVIDICCKPTTESKLQGYPEIGYIYIFFSILASLYENPYFGYGLYQTTTSSSYKYKISYWGIILFCIGVAGLYNYATCLGGACFVTAGIVYIYSATRREAGDGGRESRRNAALVKKDLDRRDILEKLGDWYDTCWSFNPFSFYRKIYNEDKVSTYFWTFIFFAGNIIFFVMTLNEWYGTVNALRDDLLSGDLNVTCAGPVCHVNRKAVRYGPFSYFAPWAKACGACLNLNSALLLLPVVRILIFRLHNWGQSFSIQQHRYDLLRRLFAHPLTRYIPLQKNIDFHKLCAYAIFFLSLFHFIFHFANLYSAHAVTMRFFRLWRWDGTNYLTGAIATYAMFMIYSAAPDWVRFSKFEIFFMAHHFFIVYFLIMFIHGKKFFYWTCFPVALYCLERYMQRKRGNRPILLIKVEWIPPVMAIYFRPVFKEHLPFKEGQYLYLNCPYISKTEWHPFTISSATDDLINNPSRIHLETGDEVMPVPRPKNLPANVKWNKYCYVHQDWQNMDPNDFFDKSDTAFNDYISIHVKVFGLEEPVARTWTRKLKEYFELMSPGRKFPFYFCRRDPRGEVLVGRQYGPDGVTPIIRVDGPHAAPAEHYVHYGTLMLIGAGIGLTPCVSILTSLVKYRWQKNFHPEIVHFYWVVRQNEIDSFQWLVHLLTELSFELKKGKQTGQIEKKYYLEVNIYVTGVAEKSPGEIPKLYRSPKRYSNMITNGGVSTHGICNPSFTAEQLYEKLCFPTVSSKEQLKQMRKQNAENRLQDIWIWNGRPIWDEIFGDVKELRQHSEIGVCFCGAATIGAELRKMCETYSNIDDDCLFSLHKENF